MTTTTTTPSSTPALFYPFRALGYITENVPFATQRRGTETFVTVSAGRAWQIYNCDKLRLALVGPQFDGEIVALAVRNLTFAAVGRDIHVCRRAHKVVTLRAHAAQITSLFVFASLLISVCADGRVMSWDCSREAIDHLDGKISNASRRAREKRERASMAKHEDPEGGGKGGGGSDSDGDGDGDGSDAAALKLRKDATDLPKTDEDGVPRPREFSLPDGFVAAAVCHPRTYLNKILLGSDDGRLLLLNVNTGLNVHVFEPTGGMGNKERAGVTCLEESPALDTIAVGLANGRVIIHNVRVDQKLTDFGHDGTNLPVRCCAFSTATSLEPLLAVGGDSGSVSVWSLEKRRLRTMTPGAHDGKVISAKFFDGSPILMTSGGDNAMKQWIFDNRDGTKRLLRFRAGHSAPPTQVTFYGEGGKRLLSAGGDRALRVFSAIQDQQSRELSQSHVERRAKKLKLAELELKLPEISGIAWGETRERDWANIVTCHVGEPRAYTWRLADGILGEHALTPPAKIGARGVAEKGKPICAVAVSACGNFAVVGTEGGDVHRFNLQSGAHRGAYKRSDADKDLDDDDDDEDGDGKKGKKGKKPFEPRRQLNLRGGANSIWNIADKSYGMDGGGGNGKNSSVTPRAPAHVGPVAAVCCDGANKIVCTAGVVDGACRVWNFSTQKLIAEMQTGVGVVKATLHSPGSLLACAGTDKIVRVLDVAGMRRVRSLRGAKTSVVSMQFSSDGRWIVGAVDDGAVLVWDVPAARLLQTMRMSAGSRVVGVSLSPSMDVLATVHEGRRGVYLWANAAMYAPGAAGAASAAARGKSLLGSVGEEEEEDDDRVRQLSENESDDDDDVDARNAAAEKETMVDLPRLHAELSDAGEILLGASDNASAADAADADDGARAATRAAKKKAAADPGTVNRPAPTPIVPGMATMALLPRSQWHNLLHLEEIKERSKPIAPPEKPEEAPFFLPTIASLEGGNDPVFAIDDDYTKRGLRGRGKGEAEDGDDGGAAAGPARSRILTTGGDAAAGDVEGVLLRLLRRGKALEEKEEAERDGAERGERGGKKRGGGGGKKKNAAKTKDAAAAAADAAGPYRELTSHLRKCGPSTLDAEIRALGPWDVATMTDADADELADVLEFFAFEIPSGRNFELTHALLTHFLRVHGGAIASRESLRVRAERVRGAARQAWEGLDALMQEVRCALGFFGGAHGG